MSMYEVINEQTGKRADYFFDLKPAEKLAQQLAEDSVEAYKVLKDGETYVVFPGRKHINNEIVKLGMSIASIVSDFVDALAPKNRQEMIADIILQSNAIALNAAINE